MEIKIEELQTLYKRAAQVAIAKFKSAPDKIILQDDGNFEAFWYAKGSGWDDEYESICFEELTEDLDKLIAERLEKERIQSEKLETDRKIMEKIKNQRKEKEERAELERLKKKYPQ